MPLELVGSRTTFNTQSNGATRDFDPATVTTTTSELEIVIARESDLDGVLALQAANQIANGGLLSASYARSQLQSMMQVMPLLVARREERVVGFLICPTEEVAARIPILRAMLDAYQARAADAYVYGPICIDAAERGRGVAQLLFEELRRLLPGREGVLFIRRDNDASLRAHRKMGMTEVSRFSHGGQEHLVLSYVG